jgi:hypothetical protein
MNNSKIRRNQRIAAIEKVWAFLARISRPVGEFRGENNYIAF